MVIIGYIVILGAGWLRHGGRPSEFLFQPVELIMIGGTAVGAFIVAIQPKIIKGTMKALPTVSERLETARRCIWSCSRCSMTSSRCERKV